VTILYAILIFLSVFGSGALMLFVRIGKQPLKLLLAFSGAFLLGISLLQLIPEVYVEQGTLAGVFILAGFFIQLILEYLTEGVEHGHAHVCEHNHEKGRLPWGMFIGVCLHSLLEGLPLTGGMPVHADHTQHVVNVGDLVIGIVLHNIPIAITFVTMLKHLHVNRSTLFLMLFLFALMTPLGMVAGTLLSEQLLSHVEHFHTFALALVVGIFLHISTTILFESSENHRFNRIKFGVIILGAGVALALSFSHGH
jgi:zinc and cadmium transporter